MRRRSSRIRRRAGALLGVGALGLGAASLLGTRSVGADTNRPGLFSGTAAAAAVHEEDNGQAGFAVYEPFYGSFAEGATTYTNDGQMARASTFWPGPTFGNTGGLVCQLQCQPVPPYPLSVQTEGPPTQAPSVSQQTSTQLGGAGQPASLTAASADATADPATGVSTDAVDGTFTAPGASSGGSSGAAPAASTSAPSTSAPSTPATSTPATSTSATSTSAMSSGGRLAAAVDWFDRQVSLLLHRSVVAPAASTGAPGAGGSASPAIVEVRSMTSSTSQHFSGSLLVSDAKTELSGVSLLGGMIDIASIRTVSHGSTDGAGAHTHTDNVTVSGVTVAGVPATIGSGGVSVSGQGSGSALLDSLNAALQQALAAAGAQVTLVGATAKPPQPLGGCHADQADGVFVHTTANAQSLPLAGDIYNGDYTLGSSCVSDSATPGSATGLPVNLPPTGGAVPVPAPAGGTVGDTGAGLSGDASGATASLSGGLAGSAGGAASPAAAGSRSAAPGPTTGFLAPLVSRRFSTLYLSVVLALAAVVVGAGIQLPRPSRRGTKPRSSS